MYEEAYLSQLVLQEFDVITLWHVLEHVHLLHERMNKTVEIMKPDGTLIIAVPNSDSWDARYYGKFWAAYDLPRHLYHFSQETMQILAQKHALKIYGIIPMKLDAFYISLLSEKYATGHSSLVKGFLTGALSNMKAVAQKKRCSSLIYVADLKG